MSIAETYDNLLQKEPKELLNYLVEEFYVPLPEAIFTAADMDAASKLIIKLSGEYSYLTALLLYAKIAVRDTKRNGAKSDYEDMIDRRDTIEGSQTQSSSSMPQCQERYHPHRKQPGTADEYTGVHQGITTVGE